MDRSNYTTTAALADTAKATQERAAQDAATDAAVAKARAALNAKREQEARHLASRPLLVAALAILDVVLLANVLRVAVS